MRRSTVGLLAVLGIAAAVALAAIAGPMVGRAIFSSSHLPALTERIVLTADLTGGLDDKADADGLSRLLLGRKTTLRDFLDALERAGDDPRVKTLFLQLGDDSLALAKTQEVRDAIRAFRAKGKVAIAFADTFGEGGPGTRPYYLATACDEIWLQPLGEVGLTGLRSETPFFRGTLDMLGVAASFEHRSEYKTAMNMLTETAMTGPQREEAAGLLAAMTGQIRRGIAEARKLSEAQVAALTDRGPLSADEAKDAKLIDTVAYRDQAIARARGRAGSGAKTVTLSHYLETAGRPHASGARIALIYGSGMITRGGSAAGGVLDGSADFTGRQMTRAFEAAARDRSVRAILFRIDSPGGSATASETIWREVVRARERGKPVVVSMGDVAASGGYYVAAPADKIVAEPATITGSIGVLAGKLVFAELMKKLGITTDTVERGANSGMFSITSDFSPRGRERLDHLLDTTYAGFKNRVAAGRHMSADAVEAVAKGRVWSGEDAKARGLVDELGGYAVALRLAKEAAKLPADAPVEVVVYPRERGFAALLERWFDNDDDAGGAVSATLERGLATYHSLAAAVDAVTAEGGFLRMPSIGDIR
jgi:protease-4